MLYLKAKPYSVKFIANTMSPATSLATIYASFISEAVASGATPAAWTGFWPTLVGSVSQALDAVTNKLFNPAVTRQRITKQYMNPESIMRIADCTRAQAQLVNFVLARSGVGSFDDDYVVSTPWATDPSAITKGTAERVFQPEELAFLSAAALFYQEHFVPVVTELAKNVAVVVADGQRSQAESPSRGFYVGQLVMPEIAKLVRQALGRLSVYASIAASHGTIAPDEFLAAAQRAYVYSHGVQGFAIPSTVKNDWMMAGTAVDRVAAIANFYPSLSSAATAAAQVGLAALPSQLTRFLSGLDQATKLGWVEVGSGAEVIADVLPIRTRKGEFGTIAQSSVLPDLSKLAPLQAIIFVAGKGDALRAEATPNASSAFDTLLRPVSDALNELATKVFDAEGCLQVTSSAARLQSFHRVKSAVAALDPAISVDLLDGHGEFSYDSSASAIDFKLRVPPSEATRLAMLVARPGCLSTHDLSSAAALVAISDGARPTDSGIRTMLGEAWQSSAFPGSYIEDLRAKGCYLYKHLMNVQYDISLPGLKSKISLARPELLECAGIHGGHYALLFDGRRAAWLQHHVSYWTGISSAGLQQLDCSSDLIAWAIQTLSRAKRLFGDFVKADMEYAGASFELIRRTPAYVRTVNRMLVANSYAAYKSVLDQVDADLCSLQDTALRTALAAARAAQINVLDQVG